MDHISKDEASAQLLVGTATLFFLSYDPSLAIAHDVKKTNMEQASENLGRGNRDEIVFLSGKYCEGKPDKKL
ncbi:hypothetical protein RND71_002293 [Anisodus tanguticus]|uniref:Uncharacterized protein n=1 Tax=Anisodus tanguticus TaxID=243964 RepID=A0AAE1T2J7_9SOLA|nr:hypothetical protein RND71_002293 [Anisodus tanguticus]